jgi:hypothetical protein
MQISSTTPAAGSALLHFLKMKWTFLAIDAPAVAWVAAALVVSWTIFALVRMTWVVVRTSSRIGRARQSMKAIADDIGRRPGEGAPVIHLDGARRGFQNSAAELRYPWERFEASLIRTSEGAEPPEYHAETSAADVMSSSAILGRVIDVSFYRALPGVLTGLGLLATFLALLIALLDVKLNGTTVEGLPLLIQGLSGKFLSSIAALFCATVLIVVEKKLFHSVEARTRGLVDQIDRIFPRLTAAQLMMRTHREIAEQTIGFRLFTADLATTLKKGVSEGVAPTMERMVTAVETLNGILRQQETTKNDSIGAQLESVLTDLQRSLQRTLSEMGTSFTSALSGSAMSQFEHLGESLAGTGRLLEGMNHQFQGTQVALQEVVQFAKASTQEQMALGRTQVEELTTVLRQLMEQMNRSASSSISQISTALTGVVHELSTKVADLTGQLAATVTDASGKATSVASAVVDEFGRWSAMNEKQLSDLLARHTEQLDRVSDLRAALEQSALKFSAATRESVQVLENLKVLSAQSATAVVAVQGVSRDILQTQGEFREVAKSIATQTEHLDQVNRKNREVWAGMSGTLSAYESAFNETERASGDLIEQLSTSSARFSNVTKEHFDSLMTSANGALADAVEKMKSLVTDLNETLEEVNETFSTLRPRPVVPSEQATQPRVRVR